MEITKEYSKTEKIKVCRHILYNTKRVVNKKHEDWIIKNVLSKHVDWDIKKGVGVDHLEVGPDGYGGICFFIQRVDGTSTDISFMAALRPHTKKHDLMKACRSAVRPITNKVKDEVKLPYTCPITGVVITDIKDIHIDHYDHTFETVFDMWIADKNIDELFKSINKQTPDVDNGTCTYFVDDSINEDFINFHNKHTHLRAVSQKANLSTLRKQKNGNKSKTDSNR